jgi:hypothetical protein
VADEKRMYGKQILGYLIDETSHIHGSVTTVKNVRAFRYLPIVVENLPSDAPGNLEKPDVLRLNVFIVPDYPRGSASEPLGGAH